MLRDDFSERINRVIRGFAVVWRTVNEILVQRKCFDIILNMREQMIKYIQWYVKAVSENVSLLLIKMRNISGVWKYAECCTGCAGNRLISFLEAGVWK